jgi:nucleotidyltransferase substrate binding protein (TIGR01987 family)
MGNNNRWEQRFENFNRALSQLKVGIILMNERQLTMLEEQGLIQAFEYNHELAWNVLKDYLEEYGGHTGLIGSRDTTREAFKRGLIEDGECWMNMITSRNLSSHTYDEETAKKLITLIANYFEAFTKLQDKMNSLKTDV